MTTSPFRELIEATFGPRPPLASAPMTLPERLEDISDCLTDVMSSVDANGETLEAIAGAVETNGNALTDALAVLEDIRDLLRTIADQTAPDA